MSEKRYYIEVRKLSGWKREFQRAFDDPDEARRQAVKLYAGWFPWRVCDDDGKTVAGGKRLVDGRGLPGEAR